MSILWRKYDHFYDLRKARGHVMENYIYTSIDPHGLKQHYAIKYSDILETLTTNEILLKSILT
jgi:hypothetical protein